MNALLVISSLCLLLATHTTAQDQATKPVDGINPANAGSVCFRGNNVGQVVTFVADEQNKCWYWQCERQRRRVGLKAKRCALGSFVSSFYVTGNFNPCGEAYNVADSKFDCTRKSINRAATPPCFDEFQRAGTCKNNGVIMSEGTICWCQCPDGFGGHDCSMAVGAASRDGTPVAPSGGSSIDDPCPGGIPRRSWCREAGNPCQNGGQCLDQCVNYVCQCTPPFTSGRNCEEFECTAGFECLNGGTCDRGPSGNAEVARCDCAPGFRGVMCEIVI